MARKRPLIAAAALAALVVAYLWWPSVLQALQGIHGPLGGGPGMHGLR